VRNGVVPDYASIALPKFDIAAMGGLVIPAPLNRRQDFQEQSIRDAEIPPEAYYPPGYRREPIPFWSTGNSIFIPAAQVPPGLWLKGKHPTAPPVTSKSPNRRNS